jgi:MerR family redox-sensitive transcriptional activator SoxR
VAGFSISHVARVTGLRASTLRYYESIGLLPEPPREGGKRRYDATALHRLTLVGRARQLGFSLREVRHLIVDFPPDASAGARWTTMASRKLEETNDLLARVQSMRDGLLKIQRCSCATIDECGQRMFQKSCVDPPAAAPRDATSVRARPSSPSSRARRRSPRARS